MKKNINKEFFDITINSDLRLPGSPVKNLAELIFAQIPNRDENSVIILSHYNNQFISISLKRLRLIVESLFIKYELAGIHKGDTVLISSLEGNNELFIALHFLALAAYGIRVLLPMYMEIKELHLWLETSGVCAVMIPEKEILGLRHHEIEKKNIALIKETINKKDIHLYDILEDFDLLNLIFANNTGENNNQKKAVKYAIKNTSLGTEALIVTTSGSSGKSKLVLYEQGAFIKSCLGYQAAGFFEDHKLGGRGFTPLFGHTMGIRTFFNALWSGKPVCLITAQFFIEKPEIVRYLLLQMKPEHITGGPAVYNLFLELMRYFPEIKENLHSSFKTFVSSGSEINNSTVLSIQKIFGIKMYNAYGTTETQQALSTLLLNDPDELDSASLGVPLPGVSLGLKKYSEDENLYHLYVSSPFGMKKIFYEDKSNNEECPYGFHKTGDIVRLIKPGRIAYMGRENIDFFKDGFGVKIPVNSVKKYYSRLCTNGEHIEYFSINSEPGLAALIFINDGNTPPGKVLNKEIKTRYSSLIGEINSCLYRELMPFEYQHRTIKRIAVINSTVPTTIKGNISKYKIQLEFHDLIKQLCDPFSNDISVEEIKTYSKNSFAKYLNPYIGQMLSNLQMDYNYHRAKKDTLYTYINGKEIPVLDFTGGYGTNLLGHNNEEVKSTIISHLQNDEIAISDQGSYQNYAGLLAEKLSGIVGEKTGKEYNVILGSTGAEAVEIALHHALFEWRRKLDEIEHLQFQTFGAQAGALLNEVWTYNKLILPLIEVQVITLKKSFHGHSSGARALLGNFKKRDIFKNIIGIKAVFIDDESNEWKKNLDRILNQSTIKLRLVKSENGEIKTEDINLSTIIAAVVEPVLGEGGVRIVNKDLLEFLSDFDFPLILDEIQCGLGRTGTFLASEGLKADYYLFAKALGGNFEKISAVLIDKSRYKIEFGKYYSSTFANGGLASKTALKTLSIIENENIPEMCKLKGELLHNKLESIKEKYTDVIEEITGLGLMQGIRFKDFSDSNNILLRNLYKEELSGFLFASYLLKTHNIRIMPTLSAPNTLRIEPSAYITADEINKLCEAIEDLSALISRMEMYKLFKPLMDDDLFDDNKGKQPRYGYLYSKLDKPDPGSVKIAFLAHFTNPTDELRLIERDFCKASDTGLRILFNRIQTLAEMKPFLLFSKNLFGGKVNFNFYLIPVDSAEMERLNKKGKRKKIINKIQETINIAALNGAKIISLGAYTSILTNNGLSLAEPEGCKIVSGNTLTAAAGVRRILNEINREKNILGRLVLGIAGAGGNIGSIITSALINSEIKFDQIYLLGKRRKKLVTLLEEFQSDGKISGNINISDDLSPLRNCNIIISATNTNDPIIFPHHLDKEKKIIISDLSVPASISADVFKMNNVQLLSFSAYVNLPEDPDFILCSSTPIGTSYCCAAEPVLLALEPMNLFLKGKLDLTELKIISEAAEKHGFFEKIRSGKSFKSNLVI